MSEIPTIECSPNGPLLAKGLKNLVTLRDGQHVEAGKVAALCRCGASSNKPFCDGTHAKVGFSDEKDPGRVEDRRDTYVGKEVTIHDNRGICAHAGFCTDRLSTVFRMKQDPWIDPDGAPPGDIIETIRACPSGALSHSVGGIEHRDDETAKPQVLVAPNGPYAVKGGIELKGVPFGEGASKEHYDLCRCGASKNKPFCDGSHWNTKFDPAE